MLNKPYLDGGHPTNDNFPILSATFVDGTVNKPQATDHYWTVELAFPFKQYITNDSVATAPPRNKDVWRINFSRVEWQVHVVNNKYVKIPHQPAMNWVWSSQNSINMHLPERWGFLMFSTDVVNATVFDNKDYNVRLCLGDFLY